jgi:hypothetical protein
MADIFLSHSSADNDAADTIRAWLGRDRSSWSVFLDKNPRDGILAGQGWQDRLRSELQSCRLVLAVITKDWLASRWCFTEAVTANFRGKGFVGVVPAALPASALDIAPPIVHEQQRQPSISQRVPGGTICSTRSTARASIRISGLRSPKMWGLIRDSSPSRRKMPASSSVAIPKLRPISTR